MFFTPSPKGLKGGSKWEPKIGAFAKCTLLFKLIKNILLNNLVDGSFLQLKLIQYLSMQEWVDLAIWCWDKTWGEQPNDIYSNQWNNPTNYILEICSFFGRMHRFWVLVNMLNFTTMQSSKNQLLILLPEDLLILGRIRLMLY